MIVVQAPLRVSFVGGGSDLRSFYRKEPGAVISAGIDKYVFVLIKQRYDNKYFITYSRQEVVDHIEEIRHDLARECLYLVPEPGGIEITFLADVPSAGSGLGSSSAITVGLLKALHEFTGTSVSSASLAEEACLVEIDRCHKPIGKQDQYSAAFGGLNIFTFEPSENVRVQRLRTAPDTLRKLSSRLLLFYTNQTRSADEILIHQNRDTEKNRELIRRMVKLVPIVREAIEAGELDLIGEMMHENWLLKQRLAEGITNPEIDRMYQLARDAGATGGKVSGAGGGGFLLLYVPRDNQEIVRQAMSDYRELPFQLETEGCKVIYSENRVLNYLSAYSQP